MTTTQITVTYCESWDPGRKRADRPIPEDTARARHAAGEPYAALLSTGDRPRALVRIDLGRRWIETALFDAVGRRVLMAEYRDFGHDPELTMLHASLHEADDEPEYGPEVAVAFMVRPNERLADVSIYAPEGRYVSVSRALPEVFRIPRPAFGEFPVDAGLLGIAGDLEFVTVDEAAPEPESGDESEKEPPAFPWEARTPLAPDGLDALLTPGARFLNPIDGFADIVEPTTIGTLRLPTGRLVVVDPGVFEDPRPVTVEVPPGDYPVLAVHVEWLGDGWLTPVAAVVRIDPEPTATWELAVRPGQDERILKNGETFAFRVDTESGAFLDASGTEVLRQAAAELSERSGRMTQTSPVLEDPASGANLVIFTPDGGSFPLWIGRAADGRVTCFVADVRRPGLLELVSPDRPRLPHIPAQSVLTSAQDAPPPPTRFDSGPTMSFFGAETKRVFNQQRSLPDLGDA